MDLPGSPSQSPALPRHNPPAATPAPARDATGAGGKRLGRYAVTGRLGQGGMGIVYEAEDTLLKRKVAIKLLPREVSTNPEALKRFLREGQAAAKLNHANVVAVHDIGEADGIHYIVMELVPGGSAQDFLRGRGRFHWTEATSILMDVCRGVAAAHKAGLIHRDIKPANILRSTEGVVKLGDFGLAKPTGRKGAVVTALGGVVGTPHYMSPEQSQSTAVDERSDIYALGATYFALLTGRPPYQAADSVQVLFAHCSQPIPDPREIVGDVPEGCAAIIRKAMAKNRSHRYASAGELLTDLEEALAQKNQPALAHSGDAPPPSFAWSRSNSAETTNPFSLADAYPGEQTEPVAEPKASRKKMLLLGSLGLGLLGVLLSTLLLAFLFRGGNVAPPAPRPDPVGVTPEDWPDLAAAADKAIRHRNAAGMKKVLDRIQVLQKRTHDDKPVQAEAMRQTVARLQQTLAFRERITEKGLVLGLDGWVTSVAFSPDDHWLAVGQGNGGAGAFVWDSYTGEKRYTLWPLRGNLMVRVQSLAFSDDSTVLAAGCADRMGVKLWRRTDGKERSVAVGPGVNRVLSVAFAPASRNLVAGMEPFGEGRGKPYLKIWNIDTGAEPFAFKVEHSGKIWSVAYTTDGQQVASGSQDKRVVLWNAETGRIWRELQTGMVIQAVACSPGGRTMAVAGLRDPKTPVLQFWDYAGSRLLASQPSPHGNCRCVAFSRRGTLLASGSGSRVLLWNPETHELLATLPGHEVDVTSLAFSAEGGILATGGEDQTLRLWDVTRFLPPAN